VSTAPPLRVTPSAAPRPAERLALAGGKLRVMTSPTDAEIIVDGRRVGVGSAFDLPLGVGERRLEVRAPGFQAFDTMLVVTAGSTLSLGRITLRAGEQRQ